LVSVAADAADFAACLVHHANRELVTGQRPAQPMGKILGVALGLPVSRQARPQRIEELQSIFYVEIILRHLAVSEFLRVQ
jgi:hypothetical protein